MDNQIPLFKVHMNNTEEFKDEIFSVLTSGKITQGQQVEKFEKALKEYMGYDKILTVNSGTSALSLAFRLLDLSPGDEVLSTPLTCAATSCSILANNLYIKWVDIDRKTMNIDLDDLKSKISENTKAICFVHWGGNVIDYDRLEEVKRYALDKYGRDIPVVEDCAHAFGGRLSYKNICCFSLQAIKHVTSGDGGIITLPTEQMYKRAKLLRWFGIDRESKIKGDFRIEEDIPEFGYKYHMNDITATIGLNNLKFARENMSIIQDNAKYYNRELQGLGSVELLDVEKYGSAYWLYTFMIDNRDDFIQYMKNNGVQVSQVHKRNDGHSFLSLFKSQLPKLDEIEKRYVSIPVGWWVSHENREYIVDLIKKWNVKCRLSIKPIVYNDFEDLKKLQKELNGYEITYSKWDFLTRLQSEGFGKVFIARLDGVAVGMAKMLIETKLTDPVCHIEDVIVLPSYRGMGICRLMVNTIESFAKDAKCYKTILDCKYNNIDLYKKLGFSPQQNGMVRYYV